MTARTCRWCRELLVATVRRDAVYCSQRCRQASHRFTTVVSRRVEQLGHPMHFAYADPPYPRKARRYYQDHPDYAGEVDHGELIAHLSAPGRYDGWALSTSADALPEVLSLCAGVPVRVAAWVRGHRAHKNPAGPLSSWEPVVYAGVRDGSSRPDSLVHHPRPRTTDPARVIGAKPATFARWLFELLGAQPGDTLTDLFPGSGGIARAWALYTSCEYSVDGSVSPDVGYDGSVVEGPGDVSPRGLHDTSCRSTATPRSAQPSASSTSDASPRGEADPSCTAAADRSAVA